MYEKVDNLSTRPRKLENIQEERSTAGGELQTPADYLAIKEEQDNANFNDPSDYGDLQTVPEVDSARF